MDPTVYELLGRTGEPHASDRYVDSCETALTHYTNGNLSVAMSLLEKQIRPSSGIGVLEPGDGPRFTIHDTLTMPLH